MGIGIVHHHSVMWELDELGLVHHSLAVKVSILILHHLVLTVLVVSVLVLELGEVHVGSILGHMHKALVSWKHHF